MNHSTNPLFDGRIADWLEEDPNTAPDQALATVLAAVPSISQRRRLVVPWRFNNPPYVMRLATAAVIAVVVLGAIYLNLPGRNDVGGPSPTPEWQTFTSERFSYLVMMPPDFVATPSPDGLPGDLFPGDQNEWADRFDEPVRHIPFLVIARATPQHPMTLADVVTSYDESLAGSCDITTPEAITVGEVPARLITARCVPYSWFDVTIEHNGHLYVLQWNAARASLDADRPTFDRVLDSFSFTD